MDEEKAEYFKLVSDALGYSRAPAPGTTSAGGFTDAALGYLVEDVKVRTAEAEHARAEAEQPGLTTEEKTAREAAAQEAEKALASSVNSTMTYMDTKGTDVSPGTEGMAALMELNTAVNTMKTETATKEVSATLTKVQAESTNVGLRMAAGAMRSMTG